MCAFVCEGGARGASMSHCIAHTYIILGAVFVVVVVVVHANKNHWMINRLDVNEICLIGLP